jgi:hypothetical protein
MGSESLGCDAWTRAGAVGADAVCPSTAGLDWSESGICWRSGSVGDIMVALVCSLRFRARRCGWLIVADAVAGEMWIQSAGFEWVVVDLWWWWCLFFCRCRKQLKQVTSQGRRSLLRVKYLRQSTVPLHRRSPPTHTA